MRRSLIAVGVAVVVGAAVLAATLTTGGSHAARPPVGIHKIKHVIVIMQENRSFDSYFGTYPGADGLPRNADGSFAVCVPDPNGPCQKPYHDPNDINGGSNHSRRAAYLDVDGGRMDGFLKIAALSGRGCSVRENPVCASGSRVDVMGYHDAREVPNYWRYAHDFVLQDHMFQPLMSWSYPEHLFLVSGWSAKCASADPMSCTNDPVGDVRVRQVDHAERKGKPPIVQAWTDLTYLLHKYGVTWRYYV